MQDCPVEVHCETATTDSDICNAKLRQHICPRSMECVYVRNTHSVRNTHDGITISGYLTYLGISNFQERIGGDDYDYRRMVRKTISVG